MSLPRCPGSLEELYAAAENDLRAAPSGSAVLRWTFWRASTAALAEGARAVVKRAHDHNGSVRYRAMMELSETLQTAVLAHAIADKEVQRYEAALVEAVAMMNAADSVLEMLKARPRADTPRNGVPMQAAGGRR